ncbi:MAG: hypothetical protein IJI97_06400 [Clostridia bacterium]|nr:hypothetical protein [Clostridia bacterium]
MKTKTTITELSHEDLVNLLSTATYGSSWLTCTISKATREHLVILPEDSREGVWAKALLNGFPIYLTDHQAEGDTYGDRGTVNPDGSAVYRITLQDIQAGLQSAMDGDFAPNDEEEVELAARCVLHLRDESFDFDATDAEILAQIIMFGSIIYA